MTNDPIYVLMFDELTVADDGDRDMVPVESDDTSDDEAASPSLEEVHVEEAAQMPAQPGGEPRRAGLGEATIDTDQPPITRSSTVSSASEAVTREDSEEASELLASPTVDTLKQWAALAFTDPSGDRVELPALATAYQSTNGLLVNAKEAVRLLFEQKKKLLCRSPERLDLKLSKEEALGWLLAHARGRRLLVEEARKIGKLAGTQATAAKVRLDAIRDAAKVARCRARKGGASTEAIDEKAAQDYTEIANEICELKHMPGANTTIVERRAPKPDPIALRRRALEAMLGSQQAFDAILAAERVESAEQGLAEFDDDGLNLVLYEETSEEYELELVSYRHALARLTAAFPDVLNDCCADGTCEHRRPCPCGRGVRGAWPWVVQTPRQGYCERLLGRDADEPQHFWSCAELGEERARWEYMLVWADPAHRAAPLPGGAPGERWMDERKYRAQSEAIRRELY